MYTSIIRKIQDVFDGKEIFYCTRSGCGGTRINFDPYCVSLCHEGEIYDKPRQVSYICAPNEFSLEKYYNAIFDLLLNFQNEEFPCRRCSQCCREIYHFRKLTRVIICPSMYCESSCIYCGAHFGVRNSEINFLPYIRELVENDLVDHNCLFDWGGW